MYLITFWSSTRSSLPFFLPPLAPFASPFMSPIAFGTGFVPNLSTSFSMSDSEASRSSSTFVQNASFVSFDAGT